MSWQESQENLACSKVQTCQPCPLCRSLVAQGFGAQVRPADSSSHLHWHPIRSKDSSAPAGDAEPVCVSLGPLAPSQTTAFKCLRAASGEGRRPRAQAGRQAGSRAQVKTGGPKRPSPLRKGEPGKPPIERERQGRYAHLGLRWRVGSLSRNFAGKTELGGVLGPEFMSPHVA